MESGGFRPEMWPTWASSLGSSSPFFSQYGWHWSNSRNLNQDHRDWNRSFGNYELFDVHTLMQNAFIVKSEDFSTERKGKREYLNDSQTHDFVKALNLYFQSRIRIPRVRMGERQEIETLINEEVLLFAQPLRNEKQSWLPRTVSSI